MISFNERAVIGGNMPPPDPTPFELIAREIDGLYSECSLWLDGAEVTNQETADGIANLLAMLRTAEAKADAARIVEKKPFDEKIAEIQKRYGALIADTKAMKGKTVLAMEACKRALQPWLDAEDRRIKEEARKAREEADRIHREAQEAIRAADHTNLAEREAAEALVRDAKKAATVANIASRQTAKAGGAMGRAASLHTAHVAVITDLRAFARWTWTERADEITGFLRGLADRLVREGKRDIPGVEIHDERKAV